MNFSKLTLSFMLWSFGTSFCKLCIKAT